MWTPFPLTPQLVGLNLLKKCEGAYIIMTIRISPMPGLASLVAEAKKRRRGDVDRFFLLLSTNLSLPLLVPQKQKCRQTVGSCDGTFAGCLLRCINRAVRDKAQQAPCPSRGSVRALPRLLCVALALSSETV